jgi:hypothetical protein
MIGASLRIMDLSVFKTLALPRFGAKANAAMRLIALSACCDDKACLVVAIVAVII